MEYKFEHDERLGINIPILNRNWEDYSIDIQAEIILRWEIIRGMIPERIAEIEQTINTKQERLTNEDNFNKSCELVVEISELASTINDLWIWYRVNQNVTEDNIHM